ncbi:MAG TPA: spore cortex-lytic enzyme, pre-pro-form [Ruminococcus sp.]|nr:spore cortex-lytic enzyme, pre-pro-form [Ruminococcus sp.]
MLYTDAQKQEHISEILGLLYQIALRDSRIPIVLPSGEFTEEAGIAVRAFQEAYGLPVTGEIDDATWERIAAVYHDLLDKAVPLVIYPSGGLILQTGDGGELVQLVQVLLRIAAQHFPNLPLIAVTGDYDAGTADAVTVLQKIAALPESGKMDRDTWNALAGLIRRLPLSM